MTNTQTKPKLAASNVANASATEIADIVRFLHAQGWTPATSSNFSYRLEPGGKNAAGFAISVSGLDKADFGPNDFLDVDNDGQPLALSSNPNNANPHARPSAEVLLHAAVYRQYPNANAVLHTHSVNGAVLSLLNEPPGGLGNNTPLSIRGFELLKAFEGIRSHTETLRLPVFSNSQDMAALSKEVALTLQEHAAQANPEPLHGFLLAGHGLYAWGETPAQAKRHIEAFETLFDCLLKLKAHGYTHAF